MLKHIGYYSWILSIMGIVAAIFGTGSIPARAQQPLDRVIGPVDDAALTTLAGNVHPLATPEYDRGAVPAETRLNKMILVLRPSPAQQEAMDSLTEAQQTPGAPEFHQWLTPAEFGSRFGVSEAELAQVTAWLESHGFDVEEVGASRLLVQFNGSAGQVAETFHTELHRYVIPSMMEDRLGEPEEYIANAQDPQIPAPLAGVVRGVLSLHDFRRKAALVSNRLQSGLEYTDTGGHYLTPSDFAMMYNLQPLYTQGDIGTGVTIAIVSRSNISPQDVAAFRVYNGLSANSPTLTLAGANLESISGDRDEAALDVEWSGAVAPAAAVNMVAASSTTTTDGVDLSAQYIVNHVSGQVMSTSFDTCEQDMGTSELAFYNDLWEQAAAEGISVLVASGNGGAAGCNAHPSSGGTRLGVNGLCTSPYSTCVGGTEFNEGWHSPEYLSSSQNAGNGSAQDYTTETVWNENGTDGNSGLGSSGGGISRVHAQPSWQRSASGASETNGMRGVPDVSLAASSLDAYIAYRAGAVWAASGTSAAAPSFAGIIALAVQATGGNGLGNINPALYSLLNAPRNPFHATLMGDNSVAGVVGYTVTGTAYNLATGLGSVDGALLVHEWVSQSRLGTRSLDLSSSIPAKSGFSFSAKPTTLPISFSNAILDPTGVNDSTAALQAAFDAAKSTVNIPAGTYLLGCTNPLYLSKNNIAYQGVGQGKTILRSCQGHTVAVASWSCTPSSGANCTSGKGPFTFTIRTATPLLQGIDNFYCAQIDSTNTCQLDNWHGEFPGFSTLDVQFTLNGAGFPNLLSTTLTNPVFNCGHGCNTSPTAQTVFTIASTVAPTANSGAGATFSLPQNVIQAYDARSNTRQIGSKFSNLTFDGGCNQCKSTSFDTGLVDMRNPRSNERVTTANVFNNVTFSNFSGAAVREDVTQGDTFANITFINAGQDGIIGDSPNNLTIDNVTASNFGWQTDVRVVGPRANYSSILNFGCTYGGHTMSIQNIFVQPSKNSQFVGFGMFCIRSTAQTATASAYSNVQISNFTILSAGNQLLPVSAFADNMTIHGFSIEGYPDPAYQSSPYMEVAGSDLNIYGNKNMGVYFAPIDEGAQVDGGTPIHTHYARINIHDNTINCTTPTKSNTGCFGIAVGGFQNSEGDSTMSYINGVNIYNNIASYTFGSINEGNVVHIALGANEGGTGIPVGQLTNVHVYNETVTLSGSQSMGGGWSGFATLWGKNKENGNWKFDHDTVKWTNTKTVSFLNHLRATRGVVASKVTVQSESTPASPLLTNESGGSFGGITTLP